MEDLKIVDDSNYLKSYFVCVRNAVSGIKFSGKYMYLRRMKDMTMTPSSVGRKVSPKWLQW